ncbi:MAG: response regulator [Gemmatimonadales bacterium]
MKILVVEDDAATRRILSRLVESSFGATVVEAENGMQGLIALEEDPPDLIITDVNMPVMDGLGLLRAIRSSSQHSKIPVVAVSASGERSQVTQLIQLGIAEYLLKPLDVGAASRRLGRLVQEIRARPRSAPRRAEDGTVRPRLLIIDPDPNFRQFFKSALVGQYEVLEAETGPKGLQLAAEQEPDLICVAEGLGLLNEKLLAGHLRQLATPPSAVYLLHAEDLGEAPDFDGLLRKTFVPEVLLERWKSLTMGGDIKKAIQEALAALRGEVVTAVQQTFGVMTQQEVTPVGDRASIEVSREAGLVNQLVGAAEKIQVSVAIHAAKAEAEQLAGAILGEVFPWDEGGNEAFGTLVETLAGRIRSSFDGRSIKLEQQPIEPLPADLFDEPPALDIAFTTPSGAGFAVVVSQARPIS